MPPQGLFTTPSHASSVTKSARKPAKIKRLDHYQLAHPSEMNKQNRSVLLPPLTNGGNSPVNLSITREDDKTLNKLNILKQHTHAVQSPQNEPNTNLSSPKFKNKTFDKRTLQDQLPKNSSNKA